MDRVWLRPHPLSDTGLFDSSLVWGSSIPALRTYKFTFHEPGLYPYYSRDYGGPEGVGMSARLRSLGQATNQVPQAPLIYAGSGASNLPIPSGTCREARSRMGMREIFTPPVNGHCLPRWGPAMIYNSGEVYEDGGFSASKTNRYLPDHCWTTAPPTRGGCATR